MATLRFSGIRFSAQSNELQRMAKRKAFVFGVVLIVVGLLRMFCTYSEDTFEIFTELTHPSLMVKSERMLNGTSVDATHCPLYPPDLIGIEKFDVKEAISMDDIISTHPHVKKGGWWAPIQCIPTQKVAIIIPYRDRWHHLTLLLNRLHSILHRQQLFYRIFLVEQAYNHTFNKGEIMNIAFSEADKIGQFDCFVFHDVDLLPENDQNLYRCGKQVRHLSPGIDEMRYVLMYNKLVGGVLALNRTQLLTVNGYSNLFWGWGGEDDDMSQRILNVGFLITRPPIQVGRYKMVRHEKRKAGSLRWYLMEHWKRWPEDGISSLPSLKYTVLSVRKQALYTNITVDVGPVPADITLSHVEKASWQWNF